MDKQLQSFLHRILKSRETRKPNLLSFRLVCLIFSFVILKVGFAVFDLAKKRENENTRISEIADWIHSEKPIILTEQQSEFAKQIAGLATKILCCSETNQALSSQGTTLLPASTLLHSRDTSLFSMFGIPDVAVDPRSTTYAKTDNANLTKVEERLFLNFADYMAGFQRYNFNKFRWNFEKFLSQQLGFKAKQGEISFNVPWIYLASSKGAIAVYPGTNVIAGHSWEITSRPWFEAAFTGETKLFASNVLSPGDKLTVTYLDVLAKSPVLVRTYLFNIVDSGERFVLAVDLHLENADVFGTNPLQAYSAMDNSNYFMKMLFQLDYPSYNEIGLFIVCFLALANFKRFNSYRTKDIHFKREQSVYGDVDINQTKSRSKSLKENRLSDAEIGGKWSWLGLFGSIREGFSKEEDDTSNEATTIMIESKLRGWEEWNVFFKEKTLWSVFGINFEDTKIEKVGLVHLFYNRDILPKGRWISWDESVEGKADQPLSKEIIMKFLCRNADLSDDEFVFPISAINTKLRPKLPDYLRTTIDPLELMSVRQNRVYVKLVKEQIKELYSKAAIKAVMTSGYVEQLLNRGQFDLLHQGRTIQRLISFVDETTSLNLNDRGSENLEQLRDFYFTSSRQLLRVNSPIQDHGSLVPVYDFAIINESIVLVAHSISENTPFDAATGKPGRSSFFVDGYISWRRSDVRFYHSLFESLARSNPTIL